MLHMRIEVTTHKRRYYYCRQAIARKSLILQSGQIRVTGERSKERREIIVLVAHAI